MRSFSTALLLISSLVSVQSMAAAKDIYSCTLRVIDSNSELVIVQTFSADESNGNHGGEISKVFTSADKRTQIAVSVDARWMMINWTRDGKPVANGAFVVSNPSIDYRVSVLYNPVNVEEQASLACDPNFQL